MHLRSPPPLKSLGFATLTRCLALTQGSPRSALGPLQAGMVAQMPLRPPWGHPNPFRRSGLSNILVTRLPEDCRWLPTEPGRPRA